MAKQTQPRSDQRRISPLARPWIIGLILWPAYEMWALLTGHEEATLTHFIRTHVLTEDWSPRWWLLSWPLGGFCLWLGPHFMFKEVGLAVLLTLVGLGLVIGVAGFLLTH